MAESAFKKLVEIVARLRAPDVPAADDVSFTSMAERGKAAEKEFRAIADKYWLTKPGKMAKYLAAVSLLLAHKAKAGASAASAH